ncbi:Transglutaminase-like superfamily protein [Planctomicrobium piriforme]|uniref:Transglutaminase-like superfamily protein n=2 Tax=Planctomicrobium piriforme TaxID=1576369 RepID=A0A1I3DHY2_9PLAN|nr:Transglutaminase-like superfamily protein [Planctomicrobium piriforme]
MSTVIRDWVGLGRLPGWQRTAAVGLLLVQNAVLVLVMKSHLLPMEVLALAGWFAPQFRLVWRLPVPLTFVPVILFFLIRCRVGASDFTAMGFIGTEVAYELASCCLTVQLLMLFMKQYERRLPIWYLAVSGAGMVMAGDIRVTGAHREAMMWLTAAYLVCWGVFASASREPVTVRRRWRIFRMSAVLVMLSVSLFLGRQLSVIFHRHENQLERVISELIFSNDHSEFRHGFSGTGGLSDVTSMKQDHGEEVALEIEADFRPDYLRGRVFDLFYGNRWHMTGDYRAVVSRTNESNVRPNRPHENLFLLRDPLPEETRTMAVWPFEERTSAHCFSPLGTVAVACDASLLKVDANGIIERYAEDSATSYVVLTSDEVPPDYVVDPKFVQIPFEMDPYVRDLAHAICDDHPTPTGKMEAVADYFQTNFSYDRDVRVPRRADRLAYFLTERMPAHCEYFATATVLLLRIAGVPARYVTGYVVTGKNDVNGRWVARRQDSHAWVEAYDETQKKWITVESTPATGVPKEEPQSRGRELFEAIVSLWHHLNEFFSSGAAWPFLQKATRPLIVISSVLLVFYFVYRRCRRTIIPNWIEARKVVPLARERIRMDRFLASRGLVRTADESLLHFARRVEADKRLTTARQMADWYREYAYLRFGEMQGEDEGTVSIMRNKRVELARQTKVVS